MGRSGPESPERGEAMDMSLPPDDEIPFVRSDISDVISPSERRKFMA
jgi:hypothetical protein